MRAPLAVVWRNLILFYLTLFLTMTTWGSTSAALKRWPRPAVSSIRSDRRGPTLTEILGLWPPERLYWRRLLELGIPGLSMHRAEKLTLLPGEPVSWG